MIKLEANPYTMERINRNQEIYDRLLVKGGEITSEDNLIIRIGDGMKTDIVNYRTIKYFAKTYEFILIDNRVITYTEQYNNY